jgi:hypothetical protein
MQRLVIAYMPSGDEYPSFLFTKGKTIHSYFLYLPFSYDHMAGDHQMAAETFTGRLSGL